MSASTLQPTNLEARLVTDPADLEEFEGEWRRLAERRGNAFVTPEWFHAWWSHRPESTSAIVVVAQRADRGLAGVMPLTLDFSHRPRMIRFAGARLGDRFGPAAREADEGSVATASMAALRRAQLDRYTLVLNHVELDRPWWRKLGGARPGGRAAIVQQRGEQPYVRLDGLDWDAYLASRSSSFRKKLRQRERRLGQAHSVIDRTATAQTLEADLDRFFSLHERRWQGRSSLDAPGATPFLRDFARAAQRRDWLRLRILEVDGTAVAALLGWRLGGTYTFYQSGFDPSWAEMSVGIVLLTRTIQSAIEEGAAEFDMLLGSEDYKRRFQNASRQVQTVVLTRTVAPARLLISAEAGARRLGRKLASGRGSGASTRALHRLLPTSRSR